MNCIETKFNDLISVAECHMLVFPKSLSTKLGRAYCSMMLAWYIESTRGILFHLAEGNKVLGYCGGLRNIVPGLPGSATSMIQFTFKPLVINLIKKPWLVFHHEITGNIPLIVRNLKLKFFRPSVPVKVASNVSGQSFVPSMGLVVIGVLPEYQGKGYGSVLLKEFEERARQEGFRQIHLSVRKDNIQAITAYKKNGWLVSHEGEKELSMYKDLIAD